jgi:Mn-dependent DtxR family transcriptional regulator
MKKDDDFEGFLNTMTHKRGLEVACDKARAAEEHLYSDKEEALDVFMKFVEADPNLKKAYMDYEEAESAVTVIELHYNYLQGIRDGIALTHVV